MEERLERLSHRKNHTNDVEIKLIKSIQNEIF